MSRREAGMAVGMADGTAAGIEDGMEDGAAGVGAASDGAGRTTATPTDTIHMTRIPRTTLTVTHRTTHTDPDMRPTTLIAGPAIAPCVSMTIMDPFVGVFGSASET